MPCTKNWLDILTALAPIAISAAVGVVVFMQWRLAREKLRLDLYNRRWAVYETIFDLYNALVGWTGTPEEKAAQTRFFRAAKESRFLFSNRSGIPTLFDEMLKDSVFIIGFKEHGPELRSDPSTLNNWFEKSTAKLLGFDAHLNKLTDAMGPYLNFYKQRGIGK